MTLQPHGLQYARPLCPPLSPRVCSTSCPLSWWCYLTITSSTTVFSFCSHLCQHQALFQWVISLHQGGHSTGASASASKLLTNIEHRLVWPACSPRDSQESSPAPPGPQAWDCSREPCKASRKTDDEVVHVYHRNFQISLEFFLPTPHWCLSPGNGFQISLGFFLPTPHWCLSPGKGKPALKKGSDVSHRGSSVQQTITRFMSQQSCLRTTMNTRQPGPLVGWHPVCSPSTEDGNLRGQQAGRP